MDIRLNGSTALVGGSSKGIGRATAQVLAEQGANVILLARHEPALRQTLASLNKAHGQEHRYYTVDYSDIKATVQVIQEIAATQEVDILVNNTGGPPAGPILNASPDEFLRAFNNHLIVNHLFATTLIPGMKERGHGRIINIISTSVKQPLDGLGVSNTIRAAVANWAKTLANEVGAFGITVNNVLPGATNTDRLNEIILNKAQKTGLDPDQVTQKMQSIIPARRFARPEEIAAGVAFLASPDAAYINGTNMPIDGGRTKCL